MTTRRWPVLAIWAVFAAIVAAIGAKLLPACAAALPGIDRSFCPVLPPALLTQARQMDDLYHQLAELERQLAAQRLACASRPKAGPTPLELPREAQAERPQQTAALKPPPPKPPLDAVRWANKDLSLLEGCWKLGHESQGKLGLGLRSEVCRVPAGRICFGKDGRGQRETDSICPSGRTHCAAPVTARFDPGGTLSTTQPSVTCVPQFEWTAEPNWLTCRRISDVLAICQDRAGFKHEFRREQ